MTRRVALVFPPHWYYASVPADLLYTGSFLRGRGIAVRAHDLSAGLSHHLFRRNSGYQALRDPATYIDADAYDRAGVELAAGFALLSASYGVRYDLSRLEHPGVDAGHIPTALAIGLDPFRNPALAYLKSVAVPRILSDDPAVVAVALVHPDQRLQVPVVGRLLRQAGFDGLLVVYGSHEDVMAPEDLAADLIGEPRHLLFDDFDGVIIGEAESALAALAAGRPLAEIPSLLAPGSHATRPEALAELPAPDYGLVDPDIYPFPAPVVDLRLSRSCPWGRCTFCAITSHQTGYRTRPTTDAARDLAEARAALGSHFFRFRDDLLTPAQLRELAALVPSLPFRPRWSARARFEAGLTRDTLRAAAEAGLEELWLGLESASSRVRNLMVKGVAQSVVERILVDASEAGIRIRALCILGYPGESASEARQTIDFIERALPRITSVALTRFQLMRNTPLARSPARFGLRLVPDPSPRHERLRHDLAADHDGLGAGEVDALLREAAKRLRGPMHRDIAGPSLSHAWMRASLGGRVVT